MFFLKMVDNICDLNNLDDSSILANLKKRFQSERIYVSAILLFWLCVREVFNWKYTIFPTFQTYASNVIISVNPYKTIENLYGFHQMSKYVANKGSFERQPHVYAIGKYYIIIIKILHHNHHYIIIIKITFKMLWNFSKWSAGKSENIQKTAIDIDYRSFRLRKNGEWQTFNRIFNSGI